MRGLAELTMRGPKYAVVASVIFACIPVLFWLSAAIVSLTILRRGINEGLKVLAWAVLPGIAWAVMGQYSVLMGLLATASMACMLRTTVSWQKTLLLVLPLGGLMACVFSELTAAQINQLSVIVTDVITKFMKQSGKSPSDLGEMFGLMIHYGVIGILAWFTLLSCIFSLALARWWQACLYNPGGFQKEFHEIRLPVVTCSVLLAIIFAGAALSPIMVILVPLASLPLLVAGLSLIHGLMAQRKLNSLWLIIFYIVMLFVTQLVYPLVILIACLDALFDFRKYAEHKLPRD